MPLVMRTTSHTGKPATKAWQSPTCITAGGRLVLTLSPPTPYDDESTGVTDITRKDES